MIGRQSSLLLTNEDLVGLGTTLLARGDVKFLRDEANESRTELLPVGELTIPIEKMGMVSLHGFLAPTEWEPKIDLEILSAVKTHVNLGQSELIQFWRSYYFGGEIRAGRVFYTPVYDDPGFPPKRPEFVAWAQRVVVTIRRSLAFDKARHAYVGEDAARRISSGELKVR